MRIKEFCFFRVVYGLLRIIMDSYYAWLIDAFFTHGAINEIIYIWDLVEMLRFILHKDLVLQSVVGH